MKSIGVTKLQDKALLGLYRRLMRGGTRGYATVATIRKETGGAATHPYVQSVMFDLEQKGWVQRDSKSRYRLTAQGIERAQAEWGFEDSDGAAIDSVDWTGVGPRYAVPATSRAKIVDRLREIEKTVTSLEMSQSEREQVRAYVAASIILSEAPEPPWAVIVSVLTIIAAVSGIASAVADVLNLITAV